jgi:hypothetical protein
LIQKDSPIRRPANIFWSAFYFLLKGFNDGNFMDKKQCCRIQRAAEGQHGTLAPYRTIDSYHKGKTQGSSKREKPFRSSRVLRIMMDLLKETRLLDFGNDSIQRLIKERNWMSPEPKERIGRIHDFGVFPDPDPFFAEHSQNLGCLKK